MKNLHKKISAMLLAGMVVVGGFAVSGVQSFAAAKVDNPAVKSQIQRLNSYSRGYGKVVSVGDKESKLVSNGYNNENCYNMGRSFRISYPSQISLQLHRAKYYHNKEFLKVQYNGLYYLIKIDK